MWMNTHDLDIRCVRLKPYALDGRVLLDVQQVIPLPEAAEYQVHLKEKTQKERKAKKSNVDFTRFDLSIRGEVHRAQWKRNAIFLVVKALVGQGVAPDRIAELIHWRSRRIWLSVEGSLDAERFEALASKEAQSRGGVLDKRRWFCDDDGLLVVDGRTYAFTNQWGKHWHKAMTVFAKAFPEHEITFEPTAGAD